MQCHQILTGAVNSGDNTYSIGSVEGNPFTVYSSGCNIIILSSTFEPVQIIPGTLNGNIQVNCINSLNDVGLIAACYGGPIKSAQLSLIDRRSLESSNNHHSSSKVVLYEPTPIKDQISEHRLDYKWSKLTEINPNCAISVLSFNAEGTKLLIGGLQIQLWQSSWSIEQKQKTQNDSEPKEVPDSSKEWACVWSCQLSTPISHLSFSPDGTLFCSCGQADRLVKIWFETSTQNYLSDFLDSRPENNARTSPTSVAIKHGKSYRSDLNFGFIYLPHPRAVIGISWRKASKYMPKGSVANMLVTSSRDNICRLWVQTFLPEDDLVNVSQLDNVSDMMNPRAQTQRHRQKILQIFKSRRNLSKQSMKENEAEISNFSTTEAIESSRAILNLPSTFSCHDFHGLGIHGTAITPGGVHFHLTASINAENDIPLVPSLARHPSENDVRNSGPKVTVSNDQAEANKTGQHNHEEFDKPLFVVNWINNKEMAFNKNVTKILQEIVSNIISGEKALHQNEQYSSQDRILNGGSVSPEKLQQPGSPQSSSKNSSSNASIITAIGQEQTNPEDQSNKRTVADYLDRKLESLMRDWNQNSDLLYSIHPLDEFLDEPCPSMFRQPQISFSSRIPNSIPLSDAATMLHNVSLYLPDCSLDLKTVSCTSSASIINAALNAEQPQQQRNIQINLAHKTQQQYNQQQPLFGAFSHATPTLCMVTKHSNGSLNLWKLSFSEKGHFTHLLSINHSKRVCGHRFRVNDIACHPILPLLLTTSHHNQPGSFRSRAHSVSSYDRHPSSDASSFKMPTSQKSHKQMIVESKTLPNTGFCSELILWKVEPVGPLMKSGGLTELARINSLEPTAFANVAWIPTLLPSTALGPILNSPSACFVASDGRQLRIYQAIIDARSLLAEAQRYLLNGNDQKKIYFDSSDEEDEDETIRSRRNSKTTVKTDHETFRSLFKIVSLQSTARPGCVLELSPIVDARHDWQNTQLLHLFQEQLILGGIKAAESTTDESTEGVLSSKLAKSTTDAFVDLAHSFSTKFEEVFYLVVIEKTGFHSTLHMWQIMISSRAKIDSLATTNLSNGFEAEDSPRSISPESRDRIDLNSNQSPPLRIRTKKVCCQRLPIPDDVEIIHATPTAGHLSSSNIYPACYAPFLIATACSDNFVRFWRCKKLNELNDDNNTKFEWLEWEMDIINQSGTEHSDSNATQIRLPGSPLYIACAYSGRIACAYKDGHSYLQDIVNGEDEEIQDDAKSKQCRYIDVGISIYECQSSGGCEWIIEDTIKIERIPLIESIDASIGSRVDHVLRNHRNRQVSAGHKNPFLSDIKESVPSNPMRSTLHSVTSYATVQTLKQTIAEQGNQFSFCQKSPLLLDWVSTEDGSHMLTCSAGHKITLLAPISTNDINLEDKKPSKSVGSILLQQNSTTGNSVNSFNSNLFDQSLRSTSLITKWKILRVSELSSIDCLPPLPMQLSWVRDGILVVGMDNGMFVFSQWKINLPTMLPMIYEKNLAQKFARKSISFNYPFDSVKFPPDRWFSINENSTNKSFTERIGLKNIKNCDKFISNDFEDFGAFESFHNSSQVMPQYHPKQLMELLAFGKIHRVRAILSHLVSSLCSINSVKEYLHYPANMQQQHASFESSDRSPRQWTRTRALSVAAAQHSPQNQSQEYSYGEQAPIVAEEIQLDYTEIASIRPLPLYALIQADNGTTELDKSSGDGDVAGKKDSINAWNLDSLDTLDTDNFFSYDYKNQVKETLDEFLGNRTTFNFANMTNVATSKFLKPTSNQEQEYGLRISIKFDQKQAQLLTKLLTHSHLPGLSSLDQMHLLALADSLASFIRLILSSNSKIGWSELKELGVGFWIRSNTLLKKIIERLAKAAFKAKNDPLDASIYYLAMKKKNLVWGLYRSCQDKKMTDFFKQDFTEDKWRKAALKNAYVLMGKQRFEHSVSFFLLAGSLWDAVEVCINKLDDIQLAMIIIKLYEGRDIDAVPETFKRLLNEEILGFRKKENHYDLQYAHPDPFLRSMAYWMLGEYNTALSTLLEINVGSKHYKHPSQNDNKSFPAISDQSQPKSIGLNSNVFNFYLYLRTQPLIVRRAKVARCNIDSQDHPANQSVKFKRSHMFTSNSSNKTDAVAVTPFERRLFFLTAYRHLQSGCPSLALEVLSRLPSSIMSNSERNEIEECSRKLSVPDAESVGVIKEVVQETIKNDQKAENLFTSPDFGWGDPSSSLFAPISTDDFELNLNSADQEELSDSEDEGLKMRSDLSKELTNQESNDEVFQEEQSDLSEKNSSNKIDIMAQQFKFIACLKILMEELSTLATGFEVDGGQLRYQLYIWLEKSVEILKEICKYHTFSMRSAPFLSNFDGVQMNNKLVSFSSKEKQQKLSNFLAGSRSHESNDNYQINVPSLHEILLADKEDFQSKLERCHRRKAWLIANEALLRNLLSYCSLHGGHGGGLASVRMELILLLQELQQDRSPQQQLLSPLPLPTTLPLLTASVASQKIVVADPIRHLQSMAQDILHTLTEINTYVHMPTHTNYSSLPDFLALPPFMVSGTATTLISANENSINNPVSQQNYTSTLYSLIHMLRDLGISLSSCIYQSLCDCDSITPSTESTSANKAYAKKSLLSSYKEKKISEKDADHDRLSPTSNPIKWPGVHTLQAMIVREKDEDLPKLHTLLCECFVASFLCQLVYALTICDSSILYRLVGLKFSQKCWGDLFGGGTKKLLFVSTASVLNQGTGTTMPNDAINGTDSACSQHYDLLNTLSKQRIKLHMKILEQLNQAAEVVGNVATSPSTTLQNITNTLTLPSQSSHGGVPGTAPQNQAAVVTEQRPTYREVFVPPKISIINYLMIKPELPNDLVHLDYDSFGSEDELDEDDDDTSWSKKFKAENDDEIDEDEYNEWAGLKTKSKAEKIMERKKANLEYELYAWCIIRLVVTKIAYEQINNFLQVSGLEKTDLPTTSTFIHAILRTIYRWQSSLQFYMNEFTNLPDHFLPNMFVDSNQSSTSLAHKYKALFETNNTPFRSGFTSIKPSKRLWNYLVRQPSVQDVFVRYIFGKDRSIKLAREHGATAVCNASPGVSVDEQFYNGDTNTKNTQQAHNHEESENLKTESIAQSFGSSKYPPEPMRIVHKDQDNISAFCVSRSNPGLIALSTPKEIQELNIKPLLEVCVPWMEEDTEMDILNFKHRTLDASLVSSYVDFLLVQHPADRLQTSPGGLAFQRQISSSHHQQHPGSHKQAILIKRHKIESVKRLAAHPTFPLYLSGGQDGGVQLWEWTLQQPISTPRPAGTYAKVTHVGFSQQGSKFGNSQCHNKTTTDFTFLNSSSLLMVAGHSTDHRNVVLVDTLVPRDRSIVMSFACHEHSGASSIAYAPLNQLLITGGKKGDVFVFDIRQRIEKHHFQAHDSAVKCIALEPNEEFFATGSADGDIKVWSMNQQKNLLYSFPGEHSRNTFFRNIGMGVSHLYIDNCGRLFSCGADGSLKMRHLPTLECQPTYFFLPNSESNVNLVLGKSMDSYADVQPQPNDENKFSAYESSDINGANII
ncbi:DmX-like protein [Sarcoptes scabiei]|uniref:DmX-like protein n=1 Tax=Sarcoptes scabiei TaxID=52283 RepID=A0A131ZWB9_SARSC|nr:DmX-like protein [Sarcoptes scabiei]